MAYTKPQKQKVFIDFLIIISILSAIIIWYIHPFSTPERNEQPVHQEPTLDVISPSAQNIYIERNLVGYVTPIQSVDILPYINGYIEKIMYKGGEEVSAGDKLIIIKQDEYKAKLEAAHASILRAQAELNNANIYYKRMQKAGTKVISQTELDNAKAAYLSAKAVLAQAKADYELAKINLDYTTITAPISGVIGTIIPSVGDYISPSGGVLLQINQFNPIRVVFSLTDKEYLSELERENKGIFGGDSIQIRLSNGQIYPLLGKFSYVDNTITRSTNSIAIYADFENPHNLLVPNAYVDVLLKQPLHNVILVPQNLVSMVSQGNFINVVNRGIFERKKIEILGIYKNDYAIKNTFRDGEYLVTTPVGRISEGAKVNIKMQSSPDIKEQA